MKYNNPMVNEVYCEFYLKEKIDANTQHQIIGLFQKKGETVEIEPDIFLANNSGSMPFKIKLKNSNKTELIQVFNNRIAFNYLPNSSADKKYLGWEYFSKRAKVIFDEIIDKIGVKIDKVSLCYLNEKTGINDSEFKIGKYLNCNGVYLPKYIDKINNTTDYIVGTGEHLKESNKQIKIKVTRAAENIYSLNIQTLCMSAPNSNQGNIDALSDMHTKSGEVFEELITDYTRDKVMGGKHE